MKKPIDLRILGNPLISGFWVRIKEARATEENREEPVVLYKPPAEKTSRYRVLQVSR